MERTKMIADYMGIHVAKIDSVNGFTWWRTEEDGYIDFDSATIYSPYAKWDDLMAVVDSVASDGCVVAVSIGADATVCLITGMGVDIGTENEDPITAIYEAVAEYVGIINNG